MFVETSVAISQISFMFVEDFLSLMEPFNIALQTPAGYGREIINVKQLGMQNYKEGLQEVTLTKYLHVHAASRISMLPI